MAERRLITLEGTKFIFPTNFAGDPMKDKFGSDARKANLIIADPEQALELRSEGFNVKETRPRPDDGDDFEPTYYIQVKANYDSQWPPKIYLVSGRSEPVLLDEDSVGAIDGCYVLRVNAVLSPYINKNTGKGSLYIRTMYVEQDIEDDPFAHRYNRAEPQAAPKAKPVTDDDLPF